MTRPWITDGASNRGDLHAINALPTIDPLTSIVEAYLED